MDAASWNERYAADDYVYGTTPNRFLVEVTPHMPPGPVHWLSEGEGRKALYLPAQGHC